MQCYCCLPISSDRSRIFVWYDTVVWYKTVWSSAVCCVFVWFPLHCSADTWPVSTICGQQKRSALFLIVFKQFYLGSEKFLCFRINPPFWMTLSASTGAIFVTMRHKSSTKQSYFAFSIRQDQTTTGLLQLRAAHSTYRNFLEHTNVLRHPWGQKWVTSAQ